MAVLNSMAREMQKKILLLVLVWAMALTAAALGSFPPGEADFANRYQWLLYNEWLSSGAQPVEELYHTPGVWGCSYRTGSGLRTVEFDLAGGRITGCRDLLPAFTDNYGCKPALEQLYFRLNSVTLNSALHWLANQNATLQFDTGTGLAAINSIAQKRGGHWWLVDSVSCGAKGDTLLVWLQSPDGVLVVRYPGLVKTAPTTPVNPVGSLKPVASVETPPVKAIPAVSATEVKKSEPAPAPVKQEPVFTGSKIAQPDTLASIRSQIFAPLQPEITPAPELPAPAGKNTPAASEGKLNLTPAQEETIRRELVPKQLRDGMDPAWKLDSLTVVEQYIFDHRYDNPSRKILNNRVDDLGAFIKRGLPGYRVNKPNGYYRLEAEPVCGIPRFLSLEPQKLAGGQYLLPAPDYRWRGDVLLLPDGEELDLSECTEAERLLLAPRFLQLIYEHRALGGDVFHMLYVPKSSDLMLIMRGHERNVLFLPSYDRFLYLMNDYWKGSPVSYRLKEVRRVNGELEAMADMAVSTGNGEFVWMELRYHFNKNYKPDVVMMVLYPQVKIPR